MAEIKKVAIANRGEIALRILSTCHEMGLKTVLLYASGDTNNEAFREADETICIGPSDPLQSYLNIEETLHATLGAGADAIHPGYGFLSENAEFAKQCEKKGLIFIGPSSQSLSLLGNKVSAREIAKKVKIPVLPSWTDTSKKEKVLIQKAEEITYPLMIKATSGGGGRGLRLVHNTEELKQQLPLVRSEALQSFNSEEIFLEKYLDSAKHIELQIFVSADKEIFILGDRDCSSQRRHQKIIEEAPSSLPEKIKEQMKEACYELCSFLDYQGAGTLEFLFHEGKFYFLEMNTRLQVEHTVTEMIYGIDLLRAQILTAMGKPAFFGREKWESKGHSIQCRICAENPNQNFLPSTGLLLSCKWPYGKSIRVDTAYHKGDLISAFYDSLLAKVIVWDSSRVRAIEKMKRALKETVIFGLFTNIGFLKFLLSHDEFIEGTIQIKSLERIQSLWQEESLALPEEFIQQIFKELQTTSKSSSFQKPSGFNPWSDFLKSKV